MNKYPTTFATRRSELAKIHMAAGQLGMDTADKDPNSEYRSAMWAVTRKRSAAELDWRGRKMFIDHLVACGAKLGFAGKPARVKPDLQPLTGKIEALLADMKLPWKYATAILKRQAGIERLEWANAAQLHDVVTALMKRQAKLGQTPSPQPSPASGRGRSEAEGEGGGRGEGV